MRRIIRATEDTSGSRTGVDSPRPDASPNVINQNDVGFMFQDLKQTDPRVWQAITALKVQIQPPPFYAEVILPGSQIVGTDVLDHPCILRLPIDPWRIWKAQSIILIDAAVACKTAPVDDDFVADVLITRNNRQNYFSLFKSDSPKAIIKKGGFYYNKIGVDQLATTELREDDEFRVDILNADSTVKDCWIMFRGITNLLKDRPENT